MAITTLAGIISGERAPSYIAKGQSNTHNASAAFSLWAVGANAGGYNGTLNGVTVTSSTAGALTYTNPDTGSAYLSLMSLALRAPTGTTNAPGVAILCDRLWHNGGITITSTTAQSIVSPAFPARDVSGSTNGDGVLLGVEVSVATGAGTPTITVSYTNSAGTAGRTATNIVATAASSSAGTIYVLSLQSGDTGVRSVESITLSATWTSGTINLVAFRPIAMLPGVALGPQSIDGVTACLPRIYDNSCLFMMVQSGGAAVNIAGTIQTSWG